MPCYLRYVPKWLLVDKTVMRRGKKEALAELAKALREKKLSVVAYDNLRRKIDACVEVPGHTHERETETA